MMAAMLKAKLPEIKNFKGLNNVSDPLRLGAGWLTQADNVDVTDTGALVKRTGHRRVLTGISSSGYSTKDFAKAYFVDGSNIKTLTGRESAQVIKSGLTSAAPMYWTEVNDTAYFNNGTDAGIISRDNGVKDWRWQVLQSPTLAAVTGSLAGGLYRVCCTYAMPDGRETGASDPAELTLVDGQALQISSIPLVAGCKTRVYIAPADSTVFSLAMETQSATAFVWNFDSDELGIDLATDGMDPLPESADVIQFWKGRMYAAQYFPRDDMTAIWFSQPLGYHLFNLASDFFIVPGRVRMLAPTESALIVGTNSRIYAYGDGLAVLAEYGVVPGMHWSQDDDQTIVFWSLRGLCRAMPLPTRA